QAGGDECLRRRSNVEDADLSRDSVGARIVAGERGERRVDLDQSELDATDALCYCKPRSADACAELDHTLARPRAAAGGEQHSVMAGAMSRLRLPQLQLAAEKGVFRVFQNDVTHPAAIRGTGRRR